MNSRESPNSKTSGKEKDAVTKSVYISIERLEFKLIINYTTTFYV